MEPKAALGLLEGLFKYAKKAKEVYDKCKNSAVHDYKIPFLIMWKDLPCPKDKNKDYENIAKTLQE